MSRKGKVYIIGAGPGDPGLMTLKGAKCLQEAEVVIYDHLISPELLDMARRDARLIYAGKEGGRHTLSQAEINQRLLEEAGSGRVVARLKGGDPFVFGRGGEEAEELARAGIPFEVVPGVTSAISVPAYAGIPLTHRRFTASVAFVTGHEDPLKEQSEIDWKSLAGMGTLVFLMGVRNLPQIAASLVARGKKPDTPAAMIRWGTTVDQETLTGTLADIAERAEAAGFKPPAILVVGGVVGLRKDLNWFETQPLFGKGVVITRPEPQAASMAALLRDAGARVVSFPTIRIAPPESWDELDAAIQRLETYSWLIFTSANGVHHFLERLRAAGKDLRDLKGIRLCTIGPATAAVLEGQGLRVDLVPETYLSEGVVAAFERYDLSGQRILLPRAEKARDVIPNELARRGASVDVVTAYRTVNSGRKAAELAEQIALGRVDVLTFTSPSTVTNFLEIMGPDFLPIPAGIRVACIGPVTAAAARKAGLPVDILQEAYTVPGLVESLKDFFARG
ncbi:uroporphyrinogen-III C-methyltransferase [Syntrophus sp. (in: bacteria)]|uniref:uroporphyrinogen-III C-methyltransferase n=1 Tax=Syntrophus sp. (in: bacteria) TaxID=48412 RepID=UPI00345E3E15